MQIEIDRGHTTAAAFGLVVGLFCMAGAWVGHEVYHRQSIHYQMGLFLDACAEREQDAIIIVAKSSGMQATCAPELPPVKLKK